VFEDSRFHYGDLDVSNGKLFVPIERGTENALLSIFTDRFPDTYVVNGFPALVDVEEQRIDMPHSSFAWLAISPDASTLWTAKAFYDVSSLTTYSIHWPNGEENFYAVNPAGDIPITQGGLPYTIRHVQGGVFSPTGLLYLVSGDPVQAAGGIFAVDTNGAIIAHLAYGYTPATCFPDWDCGDEPEGIDFLDQGPTQLHVIQVDNNSGTDALSIKHFKAWDPR
jgi:hypothetical protein